MPGWPPGVGGGPTGAIGKMPEFRDLLSDPAVADQWEAPSALAEWSVAALAGHLAGQVFTVVELVSAPPPDQDPIPIDEHYARAAWVVAGVDEEVNVGITLIEQWAAELNITRTDAHDQAIEIEATVSKDTQEPATSPQTRALEPADTQEQPNDSVS